MGEFLPQSLSDYGNISSIVGLVVTVFLFFEARKIRQSFLRRARLPEITRELTRNTSSLSNALKDWPIDSTPALEIFAKVKGLLENVRPKIPKEEQKHITALLKKLQPRKNLFFKSKLTELSEDSAWDLYADLNTVVTSLEQLTKDSKWD